VPTLRVANKADTMAFLMAGEQLVGAKQNRVLNASIMVGARSELPIPVSCVERGRWAYRSRQFGSGGTLSHGKLRQAMHGQATAGYRSEGQPTSQQGAVWAEVEGKLGRMGSHSPSHALHQVYEDYQGRLDDLLRRLSPPEGACGVVFAFGGRIAGVDLFDNPQTLVKLWPKLVRAYAIDALEQPDAQAPPVTVEAVRAWLRSALGAKAESFKSPGLGEDVRLEGDQLVGAGLLVEDQPVHVELFSSTPA
jgi:hypothetical protein